MTVLSMHNKAMKLKVTVLIDNAPGVSTKTEFGLSYWIEAGGQSILFDVAQTDLFMENATKLGVDVQRANFIVLSHGHFDHGNGLAHLNSGTLVCHPGCFARRFRKNDSWNIGLSMSRQEIEAKFNLMATETPFQLFPGAYFLGQIPRITDFESQTTPYVLEDGSPDFLLDDSALAFATQHGVFVITGCGHSGVVNILEYAKRVTGDSRLYGVMGGFHLKEVNRQTQETIRYLKENNVKHIYPSHCTGLPALSAFYNAFGSKQLRAGDVVDL